MEALQGSSVSDRAICRWIAEKLIADDLRGDVKLLMKGKTPNKWRHGHIG